MPTDAQIVEAQNTRLKKFLDIYETFHSAGLDSEEVKALMLKTGRPKLNIMSSTNFLKYLEVVADKVAPDDDEEKAVSFLD